MKLTKIAMPHGYFIVPLPNGWKARAPMGDLVGYYDTLMECVISCAEHYSRKILIARGANEYRDFSPYEAQCVVEKIKSDFISILLSDAPENDADLTY